MIQSDFQSMFIPSNDIEYTPLPEDNDNTIEIVEVNQLFKIESCQYNL